MAHTLRHWQVLVPVASVAIVMMLPLWVQRDTAMAGHRAMHADELVKAVHNAPYRIGRWIGTDVPLPEAVGLRLKPTAVLSRRYVHMDEGHAIELSIIHSSDARDMIGHYPPICYPSNGWTAIGEPDGGANPRGFARLNINGQQFTSARYAFGRRGNHGRVLRVRIFNFFVLPDGVPTADIDDVHRQISWLQAEIPGVMQVQVLTSADLPEAEAREVTSEILCGLPQVFEAVGVVNHATSQ